jgi:hypothetical protein
MTIDPKMLIEAQVKDKASALEVQDFLRNPPPNWGVEEREEYTRLLVAHLLGRHA